MNEPTGPAQASRPPVVPSVLGALLVAVVIAAALLVERATDGDHDLPERLDGGFRASDVVDDRFDDSEQAEEFADRQVEMVDSSEERLEAALDEDVTIRRYQTEGAERQLSITVVDAPAGPFAPGGPLPDPELLGVERNSSELVREGDAVCNVVWGQVVTKGQPLPDDEPAAVGCQLGADGRTYWIEGRGISADDAVELLESVAD